MFDRFAPRPLPSKNTLKRDRPKGLAPWLLKDFIVKRASHFPFGLRVGLLGGGQLARMLVLKGHEMGLSMHVLCPSATEPAAQVARHHVAGDPHREEDVIAFAKTVDVLTLESEFHSGAMLAGAEAAGAKILPTPAVIGQLQDRLPQKTLLQKFNVATAPFLAVSSRSELDAAAAHFKNRFVLKKRHGGYDGYGTFVMKKAADLTNPKIDFAKDSFIAEAFVPFRRELALQVARNPRGHVEFFPLVETRQVDNRLDWLRGPVRHPKLASLKKSLRVFLKRTDYVGVIAFELFDTGRELLVNEIAPRVHNSGHASLEALSVDQFTQHLRAILDLDLATPEPLAKGFALVNLIGAGGGRPSFPSKLSGHLHWYGKSESRAGRKMGHVTLCGPSAEHCLRQLLRERKGFKL